jgi:dual specificity protein kinase YAK1
VILRDQFIFRSHLCFVFELLSINLYELLKQNQYRGLSPNLIRILLDQCLEALEALATVGVIHCDLKV